MNLAAKYRPKSLQDVTEQSLVVDIVKNMCNDKELSVRNFLFVGPAGCGKANPLYTDILTPDGFIKMKDIKLGQSVFTHTGNIGKVSGIYPQGRKPIYRIQLSDNTCIDVSDEHINIFYMYDDTGNRIDYALTTIDLIDLFMKSSQNLFIDSPRLNWPARFTSMDPYLLGCVIGERILNGGLAEIPDEYLYNDLQTRFDVLRGILAVCDYTLVDNTIQWEVAYKLLSDSFAFLVRSLGIQDTIVTRIDDDTKSYLHRLCLGDNLSCEEFLRSSNSEIVYKISPERFILSIDYLGCDECQCIMVNHPDHTYVCTTGLIPTHNTTIARIVGDMINSHNGSPIEIDAASNSGVDAMRDIVAQARSYPIGCTWKVFIIDECHSLSQQGWQVLLKTLEENPAKSVFMLCTTNPEKIPATILSRVQTFKLSKISLSGIESRLKYIIESENSCGSNITYEDNAILQIAKLAKGGMRDAITLLEKALSYTSNLTSKELEIALGTPNYSDFFDLLKAYASKDNVKICSLVSQIYNSGTNFLQWMLDFHVFVVDVMKYVYLQDISAVNIPAHYEFKLKGYTNTHAAICLKLSQKLIHMNESLKKASYLEEVAISYLCTSKK